MINLLLFALSILTFVASVYLSVACFCIIRRMTKQTAWSLAIAIIAIAGLGAYGLIESVGYIVGRVRDLPLILPFLTVGSAILLMHLPRINTNWRGLNLK